MPTPKLIFFLNKKPLFYNTIDIDRMPRAFDVLKNKIDLNLGKVVHIVGTNGKGSTGRFISNYLYENNLTVAHYSSPHIFDFNERIWINGCNISNDLLQSYHIHLYETIGEEISSNLSYFEYTTLLFFVICHFLKPQFIILEAGLGGEFDATNVLDKNLSLVSSIDIDHIDLLGDSIQEIATTKLNSINNDAIVALQKHSIVYDIALNISNKKNICIQKSQDILDNFGIKNTLQDLIKNKNMPNFQLNNLELALSAILKLNDTYSLNLNHIDYDLFSSVVMPFRCHQFRNNIWIDVGHNQLASCAILEYFLQQNKKLHLVYNSFSNKDYKQILTTLKPIVDKILYIDIKDSRMATKDDIYRCALDINIDVQTFTSIDEDVDYLVFGSFVVVQNFIQKAYPSYV